MGPARGGGQPDGLRVLLELGDHLLEHGGRRGLRRYFVGGREQVPLGLAVREGRQAKTGGMRDGLLVPLEVPGFLPQQRDDLRDPEALRDRDLGLQP